MTRRLLLAFSILLVSVTLKAQQSPLSNFGRDFYLAEVRTSLDCPSITPFQSYWVVVSSPYDCHVTISYFDQVTGQEIVDHSYPVLAKNFVQIPISQASAVVYDPNTGNDLNPDGEVPEYTAIHVYADRPISVSYFSTGPNDAAMYLALPTSVLGKKYVVAASPNNDGTGVTSSPRNCNTAREQASSYFAIVAVKDGTHVKIDPSGTTRRGMIPGATSGPNNGSGTPTDINVILNRGQVYKVKSEIKTSPAAHTIDMTGSQITSDQPIAVIAGCENALNGKATDSLDDQRNLTAQMMVPVDYWASTGYLVVPLNDAPNLDPNDNSYGDQVKVIVGDQSPANCLVHADLSGLGASDNAVSPYQYPPLTYNNVAQGTVISSQCDQKIFVEQYDYRARGTTYPFTAPSQMNVVPMQNFARSFMWSIPSDILMQVPYHYINVIANANVFNKIKLWKDGKLIGTVASLPTSGSTTFPSPYQNIVGRRYALGVGCYYATCDSAFAIYQYGMAGYDYPDKDIGDFDGDDYFFEYSAPAGETFHIAGSGQPMVAVDTICDKRPYWMVHVTDTAALDHFISATDILKDPLGIINKRPNADTGYTSYNVEFGPTDLTVVPGLYTKDSAKVVVQNPLMKAEAWVAAVNGAGNDTLVHLVYVPPTLKFGAVTSDGVDANGDAKLDFKNAQYGVDTCSWFVFKNVSAPGSKPLNLMSLNFELGGQGFSAQAVDFNGNPLALPIKMATGDSVIIRVCFNTVQAGRILYDTLLAQTDCPAAIGYVSGSTSLPEITATDYDFGAVVVGDSVCHAIYVTNTGQASFMLTKQWILTNFVNPDFTFADASLLPLQLQPGKSVALNFCFHPSDTVRDSSVITWGTDISQDRKTVKKNFSILKGLGIKPALEWNVEDTLVTTACDTSLTFRLYLINNGTALIYVDSVRIIGPTMSEWKIAAAQVTTNNFILGQDHLPDSVWYDIAFAPDPAFNCIGEDKLVAYDENKIYPVAVLIGNATSDVATLIAPLHIAVSPNPVKNELLVSVSDANKLNIEIVDILGNRMIVTQGQGWNIPVDVRSLPAGVYFVRVQSGANTATCRIVKE